MKNGTLTFRLMALAVMALGLISAVYWFSIGNFKIELAIIIVACLLAGYLAGERRAR